MAELESYILQRAAVLELQYPFTKEELTNSFRKMAFKVHPDMGGKPEQFIKVKAAYDDLLTVIPDESTDSTKKYTSDGHLFSELGKGLGDLINSNDCPECHAAGYTVTTHTHTYYEETCPNCEGRGYVWTAREFFFSFSFSGMEKCTRCQGHGGFKGHSAGFTSTHYCYHCNGTGQIEIPNPTLPKGRVISTVPNIDKRPRKQYCKCGALLKRNGTCWRCSGLAGVKTQESKE